MSETTSAKEMDERERFTPSQSEINFEQQEFWLDWFLTSTDKRAVIARMEADKATLRDLHDWVAEETERRMAADCDERWPF